MNSPPASILETSELLRQRSISPVEITRQCLDRIQQLDPILNTFIRVTADAALAQAQQAEEEIMRGAWRGPLHGIPLALKDLIDVAGLPTTCASQVFANHVAGQDAEVVRRLRQAGVVILGKNNLHECAYGGSSVVSYYGEVHNPWNPDHIAGGSSGGSASAVAAALCYGAVGTDTGGSVREPAALCGVVGLKPTFGQISVSGVFPLAPTFDHVGPIARTVADTAVLLEALTGIRLSLPQFDAKTPDHRPFRVGIPREFFFADLDPEVAAAVEEAITVLAALNCEIRDIEVNEIDAESASDRTLFIAESYATHQSFAAKTPELYQPETLRRILSGENISKEEVAQKRHALQQSRHNIASIFEQIDFLVTPTTPIPAPPIAQLKVNPDQLRPAEVILLRNTRPFNFWGLPAISIPCGFTRQGLPIGLQIAGPHNDESQILQLAQTYEKATEWHKQLLPNPISAQ